MKLPIFITSRTEQDLENIYDWYEKRSKGLGSEFIRIINSNLAQIQRYPEAYPVVLKNLRRKIIRRFPYALFYLITEKQITACLPSLKTRSSTTISLPIISIAFDGQC